MNHKRQLLDFIGLEKSDYLLKLVKRNQNMWNLSKSSATGPKILLATSMSGYEHAAELDRILAIGLTLKGCDVSFLLCQSNLQACQLIKISSYSENMVLDSTTTPRCTKCASNIDKLFAPLDLPIHHLTKNLFSNGPEINDKTVEQIRQLKYKDINVGEHAYAGVVRYYASSNLIDEKQHREILLRYLKSAYAIVDNLFELFEDNKFDTVIANHGIYLPQGIVVECANKFKIDVVTWTPSYRNGSFIFSANESYHHSMITEDTSRWRNLDLNILEKYKLKKYLASRARGKKDWIKFSDSRISEGIDKIKLPDQFSLALTSVTWDAELHYVSRAFPNMKEWLRTTLDFYRKNPQFNLVIRIHPAEITSPNKSREPMLQYLKWLGVEYLKNVLVIGPESKISTYYLIIKSNNVLIYNTKTGIEASARGKPVLVAGEAWIKGKGFSFDAYSEEEYLRILSSFAQNTIKLNVEELENATKYAYHFFFKRMIPLKAFGVYRKSFFSKRRCKVDWKYLEGKVDRNFSNLISDLIIGVEPKVH